MAASRYTYDACISLALECTTRAEFKSKHPYAYRIARESQWLADYTWFQNGKKKPKKYTFEKCLEIAKQCATLKEFYNKHYSEYMASKRSGWLDKFTWIKRERRNVWTFSDCRKEALKYSTKKDFRVQSASAYNAAREKGWLDKDFTWLLDETINIEFGRIYIVYCYEFFISGDKFVYVGLTMRPKDRDRRHRQGESAVRSFATNNQIVIPPMHVLERNLTQIEAREKEHMYCRQFKEEGCILLNKAATGKSVGSIGGMHRKWTKRKCLEEARKYKTAREFQRKNNGAYLATIRHKWQKDITWFNDGHIEAARKRRKYDFDSCRKLALEMLTIKDFRAKYPGAYTVAKKYGWLNQYIWLFDNEKRARLKFESRIIELYRKRHTIEEVARIVKSSNQVVRRILIENIPNEFRGKYANAIDEQQIIADYKKEWKGTKTEFALAHGLASLDSLNYVLRKHGLSIDAPRRELNFEECKQIAQCFRNRKEFRNKRGAVYRRVYEMGWLDKFEWLNKKRLKWTYERCACEAKKYKFKSVFKQCAYGAYRVACANNWLKDFTWFKNGKVKPHKWNQQLCYAEAKKYKTISDFAHKAMGAYKCAHKYGWLKDYSWFHKRGSKVSAQLEFDFMST